MRLLGRRRQMETREDGYENESENLGAKYILTLKWEHHVSTLFLSSGSLMSNDSKPRDLRNV